MCFHKVLVFTVPNVWHMCLAPFFLTLVFDGSYLGHECIKLCRQATIFLPNFFNEYNERIICTFVHHLSVLSVQSFVTFVCA